MFTQWTWYVVILILNTLACAVIAFLLGRKSKATGQIAMLLSFVALAFWTFGYAMLLTATSLEWKVFWLRFENLGIVPQSLFWFFFAFQYSRQSEKLPVGLVVALSLIPAVSLTFIFSDNLIQFYYPSIELFYPNGGPLKLGHGGAYWAQFAQTYLLMIASLVLLLRRFLGHREIYRRQMALLMIAVFFPLVANIYFQLAPRLSLPSALTTNLDVTPLTFAISAALVSGAVFGLKLFDLIPIARYRVLEYIPQMVFVVDADNRILDINDTGQKWLGEPAEKVIGSPLTNVFAEWREIISRFEDKTQLNREVQIPSDPPRTLEVSIFPIYNRGKLEGRVFVAHDITSRINLERELKQANESLKNQIAEVQALREKLEEQAIRDPLTGVYNRRFLTDTFAGELAQALKKYNVLSVVMLDLDRFKNINDKYGSKCGDTVLQMLTKQIIMDLRRGDLIARYGGEEFVVLMPGLSLESAYSRVEKWRSGFGTALIEFEGNLFSATFSAGVSCFPIHGYNEKDLLQAAESALGQAKSSGRNRVVIHS